MLHKADPGENTHLSGWELHTAAGRNDAQRRKVCVSLYCNLICSHESQQDEQVTERCTHTHTHTHTHACAHTRTHTHARTHTYTHAHTPSVCVPVTASSVVRQMNDVYVGLYGLGVKEGVFSISISIRWLSSRLLRYVIPALRYNEYVP